MKKNRKLYWYTYLDISILVCVEQFFFQKYQFTLWALLPGYACCWLFNFSSILLWPDISLTFVLFSFSIGAGMGLVLGNYVMQIKGFKDTILVTAILFIIASLGISFSFGGWSFALFCGCLGTAVGCSISSLFRYMSRFPKFQRNAMHIYVTSWLVTAVIISFLSNYLFDQYDARWQLRLFAVLTILLFAKFQQLFDAHEKYMA